MYWKAVDAGRLSVTVGQSRQLKFDDRNLVTIPLTGPSRISSRAHSNGGSRAPVGELRYRTGQVYVLAKHSCRLLVESDRDGWDRLVLARTGRHS